MRRALAAVGITATLLVGGAVAAVAAPDTPAAAAKNTSCVTATEFGKVQLGMSKAKVAKLFGTKGKRLSVGPDGHGYTNEVRRYKACKAPGALVDVTFASGDDLPAAKVGWANQKNWFEGWTQ